jgi:hypothetical protein
MAIQTAIEQTDIGIPAPEAYARIMEFTGNKKYLQYRVAVYMNAAAREIGGQPIRIEQYDLETPKITGDIMAALYADLKTHPGFEGASDV